MSLTVPDFNAVPRAYVQALPPAGTELDQYEAKAFGNLSQWLYLNEPSYQHLHVQHRLTDSYYCQADVGCEENFEDQVEPCLSVFAWNLTAPQIPSALYRHLCIQLTQLSKAVNTDLYAAHFVAYYASTYQTEDDEKRLGLRECPDWLQAFAGDDRLRIHETLEHVEQHHPELIDMSDEGLAISKQVERIAEAERAMIADSGPIEEEFNYPEHGLYYLPHKTHIEERTNQGESYLRSGIDPDALHAAVEASYECESRDNQLIRKCNNTRQLKRTIRYLREMDNLIELLCQIETTAQSRESMQLTFPMS